MAAERTVSQPELKTPQPAEDVGLGRTFAHERTVFIVCATLVGVCLTGGGLIRVAEGAGPLRNLSRFLLAVDALVFLVGALASFAVSRALAGGHRTRLQPVADAAMLLGLVGIVAVCFTLLLTIA
jgi:hypothetical protein